MDQREDYPAWVQPAQESRCQYRGRFNQRHNPPVGGMQQLPRLGRYDGTTNDLEAIARSYVDRAEELGWDEGRLKFHFRQSLEGRARTYFYTLNNTEYMSFDEIIDKLLNHFEQTPPNRMAAMAHLNQIKQDVQEDLDDFATRVRKLAKQAFPEEGEVVVISAFAAGLDPKYRDYDIKQIFCKVEDGQYTNVDEVIVDIKTAMRVAQRYGAPIRNKKSVAFAGDSSLTARRVSSGGLYSRYSSGNRSEGDDSAAAAMIMEEESTFEHGTQVVLEKLCVKLDKVTDNFNKMVEACSALAKGVTNVKDEMISFRKEMQGDMGTLRKDVQTVSAKADDLTSQFQRLKVTRFNGNPNRSRSPSPGSQPGSPGARTCFKCGSPSHFKNNCPKLAGNASGVSGMTGHQSRPQNKPSQQ